eukprot:gene11773-15754_t
MASDTRSTNDSNGKAREKVVLKPGFHLMDWMRLSGALPPPNGIKKITLEELSKHNTQFDCWMAYKERVYNVTQYMHYHPGGIPKIMLAAGKDGTALFDKYHKWVNIDSMLGKNFVGMLVIEEKKPGLSNEDEIGLKTINEEDSNKNNDDDNNDANQKDKNNIDDKIQEAIVQIEQTVIDDKDNINSKESSSKSDPVDAGHK